MISLADCFKANWRWVFPKKPRCGTIYKMIGEEGQRMLQCQVKAFDKYGVIYSFLHRDFEPSEELHCLSIREFNLLYDVKEGNE